MDKLYDECVVSITEQINQDIIWHIKFLSSDEDVQIKMLFDSPKKLDLIDIYNNMYGLSAKVIETIELLKKHDEL